MNEKKLFTDPRWNDPGGPIVIGHREFTEEEKEEHRMIIEQTNKHYGINDDDDEK